MLGSSSHHPLPAIGPDWSGMLPAIALWALALYLPLSAPLARLEDSLAVRRPGRISASLRLARSWKSGARASVCNLC